MIFGIVIDSDIIHFEGLLQIFLVAYIGQTCSSIGPKYVGIIIKIDQKIRVLLINTLLVLPRIISRQTRVNNSR